MLLNTIILGELAMDMVKNYVKNVSTFIERFAFARLSHLGASVELASTLAEHVRINVMKKDPSPIKYWKKLQLDEKKNIAVTVLMLRELKYILLRKDNETLIDGLNEFIVTSTKSLEEAKDEAQLVEAMKDPVEKIQTFNKVHTLHRALQEAQAKGDEDALAKLKAELDKLS